MGGGKEEGSREVFFPPIWKKKPSPCPTAVDPITGEVCVSPVRGGSQNKSRECQEFALGFAARVCVGQLLSGKVMLLEQQHPSFDLHLWEREQSPPMSAGSGAGMRWRLP